MPNNRVGRVLEQLRHVADLTDAQTSDKQLLAAFLSRHDETAFAVLVRRYGPMIHGVCRRVLRNDADAEDAFQATFLVLVRRAEQAGRRSSLANWLYGVAYRTALHARSANARRCRLEAQVRPMARNESPTDAAMYSELQQLLDQELNALPEKYRAVVVLCDLLGTTKREAAQQLRCPEGTVSSRLARGRELLRKRLTRHGAALSLAALAAFLEQNKAPASAPLIDTTVKTAALVAAGNVIAATGLAPNAAVLMEGVLKSMLLTKLKIATGLLLVFAVLGATTTLIACRTLAAPQPAPPNPPAKNAPVENVANAKDEEKPRLGREHFRYGGKDFAYWRDVMRDDLKPEVRLEALKPLAAFAANGYATEATATVLDVMDDFNPRESDNWTLYQKAPEIWAGSGRKVIPSLAKEWEHRRPQARLFIAQTLAIVAKSSQDHLQTVSLLICLLKDKDRAVRLVAVEGLFTVQTSIGTAIAQDPFRKNWNGDAPPDPAESRAIMAGLSEVLKDDEDGSVRRAVVMNIRSIPDLILAANNDKDRSVRLAAVTALYRNSSMIRLVSLMTQILEQEQDLEIVQVAANFFESSNFGSEREPGFKRAAGEDPLPSLIEALRTTRRSVTRKAIIHALHRVGPEAKGAVPVLRNLIDGTTPESDPKVREAATKALEAIQPKP